MPAAAPAADPSLHRPRSRRRHRRRTRRAHRRLRARQGRAHRAPCSRAPTSSAASARPSSRDGWRFDIGGHRFFTKVPEVEALWHEILPDEDFMQRPALEPHLLPGQVLRLPAQGRSSALRTLGLDRGDPLRAVVPVGAGPSAEGPVDARGLRRRQLRLAPLRPLLQDLQHEGVGRAAVGDLRRLGRPAHQGHVAVDAPCGSRSAPGSPGERGTGQQVTSLIEEFQYPKHGPGMMWERCQDAGRGPGLQGRVRDAGHQDHPRRRARHRRWSPAAPPTRPTTSSRRCRSTRLLRGHGPAGPGRGAAGRRRPRASATSSRSPSSSPPTRWPWTDNWIYIHDPEVKTMRVQNFGSWSPYMVQGRPATCSASSTRSHEGDEWWTASDDELIEKGKAELEALGLMQAADVEAGYVVRMPKAYPVYDDDLPGQRRGAPRAGSRRNTPNVHPVGRNGMHRYNNQDHSMFTAMLTVENILGASHDIWEVNVEEEYHEEASGARPRARVGTHRSFPTSAVSRARDRARPAERASAGRVRRASVARRGEHRGAPRRVHVRRHVRQRRRALLRAPTSASRCSSCSAGSSSTGPSSPARSPVAAPTPASTSGESRASTPPTGWCWPPR